MTYNPRPPSWYVARYRWTQHPYSGRFGWRYEDMLSVHHIGACAAARLTNESGECFYLAREADAEFATYGQIIWPGWLFPIDLGGG